MTNFILLCTKLPTQDLKTNEPRLRDINQVADDLLYEKLLTPQGAQIQQVTKASPGGVVGVLILLIGT